MTIFWQVCLHLESLELKSIYVSLPPCTSDSITSPSVRFPRLKRLALNRLLHATPIQQLGYLISICPTLKTLEWDLPVKVQPPIKEFTEYFAAKTWPELDTIKIKGNRHQMSDLKCAAIL